jgi:hypothetical protein
MLDPRPTVVLAALLAPATVAAEGVRLAFETGALWQSRNDVRIPGDEGTRFALDEITGSGPWAHLRLTAEWDISDKHGLRLVYAPLRLSERGAIGQPVDFAGGSFAPGALEATYQFNAHRVTYRYMFLAEGRWQLRAGATLLVRDAQVRLRQGEQSASDSNVGLVPLLHFAGSYRIAPRWSLGFELDGLAAPQGRAFDLGVRVEYALTPSWDAYAGYRTLEGGVDNDDVYNFAWFNYAVVGVARRF